ncbi:MAG: decarboxylase [Nanoarchaeota archaeon]|nr:decarboxylase [Nanoarchaeota archaeon]|tara:strand:- start:1954 stop:3012 length:1059 start_codon:yes stop_codon:yes gene_type:complete
MKPKFILSKQVVLSQFNKVNQLANIISYSSKTNPLITPILEEETNSMFSIHMINELQNVKDASRVLFLAQAWDEELIKNLINQNVTSFVVDNESDLNMLLKFLETSKAKINLLLRLKLRENTLRTERYFVFGMKAEVINKKILEIVANKNIKDNIHHLGIHFHRKTQNMAEWNYEYELQHAIKPEVLNKISIINMGGGLPSDYANTNVNVITSIFNKIKEFKAFLNGKNIKLMIEPGRFISAPAMKLQTQIIGMHDNNIIVNASVYNSDMDALIVPVKLLVEGELSKEQVKENNEIEPYVIKGITPCSMDLFRYRVYLDNPKIGDTLTFLNAGAYNFTTEFCDLDIIETVIE